MTQPGSVSDPVPAVVVMAIIVGLLIRNANRKLKEEYALSGSRMDSGSYAMSK